MATIRLIQTVTFLFLTIIMQAQDTVTTNYPNTTQTWEKVYVDGKKVSENIYHDNGTPWMTFQYEDKQIEKYKWFHDNGNPFFEALNVNGNLQGSYRIWYENGQVAEQLNFTDNMENGPATFYYPNGQLAMKGQYDMGSMIGKWEFYDKNGSPATGEWNWSFAALPENVRLSGVLQNGTPTGEWKYRTTATSKKGKQEELTWNR